MAGIQMAAIVSLTVAEGVHVAPGNVFSVETQEEALRLAEIGAATILGEDAGAGASEEDSASSDENPA